MIGRLLSALRREGPAFFGRQLGILARRITGFERVVVFRTPPGRRPDAERGLTEVRDVGAPEARSLPWDADTLRRRLAAGSRLFAVSDGGALTSFAWVTRADSFHIGEIRRRAVLEEPMVWVWDAVTPAPYRGKGYYTRLLRALLAEFGSESLLIYCRSNNLASIRGIRKAGFVEWLEVATTRVTLRARPIHPFRDELRFDRAG